jgi:hypothetical protein
MSRRPPRLGEWLITLLGAPDALVGDLHESCERRGRGWYWRQVGACAVVSAVNVVHRHPIRAAWCVVSAGVVCAAVFHAIEIRHQPKSDEALHLELLATGWMAADGTERLLHVVPAVRVRVVNRSSEAVRGVQLNAVFRRVTDRIEWGNQWHPVSRGLGLAPGATSEAVLVTSATGHVSGQPADATLQHPSFVDATVQIYGRYGAHGWAQLGAYRVPRQLVEP